MAATLLYEKEANIKERKAKKNALSFLLELLDPTMPEVITPGLFCHIY